MASRSAAFVQSNRKVVRPLSNQDLVRRQQDAMKAIIAQDSNLTRPSGRLKPQANFDSIKTAGSTQQSTPTISAPTSSLPPHLRRKQEAKTLKENTGPPPAYTESKSNEESRPAAVVESKSDDKVHPQEVAVERIQGLIKPGQRKMTALELRSLNTSPERRVQDSAPRDQVLLSSNEVDADFQCAQCHRWAPHSVRQNGTTRQLCIPCEAVDDRIDPARRLISHSNIYGQESTKGPAARQWAEVSICLRIFDQ